MESNSGEALRAVAGHEPLYVGRLPACALVRAFAFALPSALPVLLHFPLYCSGFSKLSGCKRERLQVVWLGKVYDGRPWCSKVGNIPTTEVSASREHRGSAWRSGVSQDGCSMIGSRPYHQAATFEAQQPKCFVQELIGDITGDRVTDEEPDSRLGWRPESPGWHQTLQANALMAPQASVPGSQPRPGLESCSERRQVRCRGGAIPGPRDGVMNVYNPVSSDSSLACPSRGFAYRNRCRQSTRDGLRVSAGLMGVQEPG